jgi:uncharacterized membrane protein YeaQ/YmgE (transglycosylase-associated protein family)
MHVQDYVAAIIFGAVIGIIARILLPGRQRIGIILTVLIGMAGAAVGTWLTDKWNMHSTRFFHVAGRTFDWEVVGVQVGVAIVGIALVALLARAFTIDRREDHRSHSR